MTQKSNRAIWNPCLLTGHVYNVEKKDRPGETLDQEAPLSRYEETEFYVARQNSRRARGSEPQVPKKPSGDANFVSTINDATFLYLPHNV